MVIKILKLKAKLSSYEVENRENGGKKKNCRNFAFNKRQGKNCRLHELKILIGYDFTLGLPQSL